MKSQINLLHDQFIPKFEWVCAQHFVGLIVIVTMLCGASYGVTNYVYTQKEAKVAAIKRQIQQQQSSIEELTNALSQRLADPSLQEQLSNFAKQTGSRNALLDQVRSLSTLKQRSFSSLFDSLAQSSSSELWLTQFLVTPEQLDLAGGISTPRALPKWISQLSKTEFFAGQEFSVAKVERKESGLIFILNSVNSDPSATLASVEVTNE